jgi:hypothetical protein
VGRSAIDRSPTDHAMLDSDGVELTMEARGDIERLAEGPFTRIDPSGIGVGAQGSAVLTWAAGTRIGASGLAC